jgi:hypothetical protein
MNDQASPLEAVGKNYDADQMMVVRDKTREAVNAIAAAIKPGMIEDETVEMAKDMLSDLGLLRGWHDVCIRFGENTAAMTAIPANPKRSLVQTISSWSISVLAGSIGKATAAIHSSPVRTLNWRVAPQTSKACSMRYDAIG